MALTSALFAPAVLVAVFGRSDTTPRRSPSSAPSRSGIDRPAGVVSYAIEGGRRISRISADAGVTDCVKGSIDLKLLDLEGERVLYADHGALFEVSVGTCLLPPLPLVTYRALAGRAPNEVEGEGIQTASLSPDGSRMMVSIYKNGPDDGGTWIGNADGSHWKRITHRLATGWVDDKHVLIVPSTDTSSIDPVGVAADSGRVMFLQNPDASQGSFSPDGRWSVFTTSRSSRPATYFWDRATDHLERLPKGAPELVSSWSNDSLWNASSGRVLLQGDTRVFIYARGAQSPLTVPSPLLAFGSKGGSGSVGWFSDDQLWFVGQSSLEVLNLGDGRRKDVFLPGFTSEDPTGVGIWLMVDSVRPGATGIGNALLSAADTPRASIPDLNLGFHRPPSWVVQRCRSDCSNWGYRQAWLVRNSLADTGPSLAFAETHDSVNTATARVLRASGLLAACDKTKMLCAHLSRRKVHLAGEFFTELDIYSDEGGEIVDIGSVNGRTLLMFRGDYFDPSIDLIQGSLTTSAA